MILPVSDQHCRNTAARIGLLPKGFITADARTAIYISEGRIMQDWTAVEQRKGLVLQYHCCAQKILNTKASLVTGG